jgi:hypothetical protein
MCSLAQEGDVAQHTNLLFIYFFKIYRWSSAQEGDVDSIRALHADSPGLYFFLYIFLKYIGGAQRRKEM